VVAVALVVLVVSASPVAASHGQLAVGSEHRAASDFDNGTLSSAVAVGSASGYVTPTTAVSDGFEDGDTSGWTVQSGDTFSAQSTTVFEGGYASELTIDSAGYDNFVTFDSATVTQPTTYRISGWVRLPDGDESPYLLFRDSSTGDQYVLRISAKYDDLSLRKYSGGSSSSLDSGGTTLNNQTWYKLQLSRNTRTGELTGKVFDSTGSVLDTVSATDSSISTDYAGVGAYRHTVQWDQIEFSKPGGGTGWYRSANHSVDNPQEGWANLTLSNASATVEWQAWDSSTAQWQVVNSSQYSSSGNHTLDVSGTDYEDWRVNVSFEKTGSNPTAKLHDEGILVETDEPTVDNASATPDTTSESKGAPLDLTIPVDDPDFGTSHGDTVSVDFYVDGTKVATETTSSVGNVSTTISDLDAGDHTWHAVVSDEYGHSTTSATFDFTTASELRIYDEQNPDELVKDNVTVTIRLYADDSTVEREVTDGTLNMSGLPLNSTIVATTEADGWIDRRVLIRDLTQQQEIYLLNSSANSVSVTFDLEDKTGDFSDDSSQLYVQKALNTSTTEELEWKTVTGDFFGADGTFPTDLAYSQRYRLVIRNNQGDVRVLGSYIPTEDSVRTITLGEIVWDVPEGEQVVFHSNRVDLGENADDTYENASEALELKYNDSEGVTEELHISVTTRDTNETVYETTVYGVSSYKNVVGLTPEEANASLVVNASAVRHEHENFTQSGQMGGVEEQDIPMDPNWVSLFTQLTIGALICLVAGKMPKTGGLVVLPVAFGVTWLGFWSIHPASLGFAGMIALYRASNTEGGGY
jgi:hypothetical protein